MASEATLQMWRHYWSSGRSKWHLQQANDVLVRNFTHLTEGLDPDKSGLVLVPLSGKSVDLLFLYDRGLRVLGVEICEEVIEEFFSEHQLEFVCTYNDHLGKVYSTKDGRLRIISGDILKLTPDAIGELVDMVWDRAALVAIEKDDFVQYARVMKNLVKPGGKYLLVSLHYDSWSHSGPPYDVSPSTIGKLFGDRFDVTLLETVTEGDSLKQYLAVPDKELVHLLTDKKVD